MGFFQERAVITLKTDQKGGIGEIMAAGDNAVIGLRAIGLDDRVRGSATGRLVVSLGRARPVMPHAHAQSRERLQVGPVLPVDPHRGGEKADHAGLAGFLAGVALVEAAGGAPRLHGTNQAK